MNVIRTIDGLQLDVQVYVYFKIVMLWQPKYFTLDMLQSN